MRVLSASKAGVVVASAPCHEPRPAPEVCPKCLSGRHSAYVPTVLGGLVPLGDAMTPQGAGPRTGSRTVHRTQ